MRTFIKIVMLALALMPSPGVAKSIKSQRLECVFSFGIAKQSCKKGFHGMTYGTLSKVSNKFFVNGVAPPTSVFGNSEVQNIMIELMPDQFRAGFDISGNGVQVGWRDKQKVKAIMKAVADNGGKFKKDMMYEVIPDSIRIFVGVRIAFVLTASVGASGIYESERSILEVLYYFKHHRTR